MNTIRIRPAHPSRIHYFFVFLLSAGIGFSLSPASPDISSTPIIPTYPASRVIHDNRIEAVFTLDGYVNRLVSDIENAEHSVAIDAYILGGEAGMAIARALLARNQDGLDVRVLLDRHLGAVDVLQSETERVLTFLTKQGVPLRFSVTLNGGWIRHRWSEDHHKLALIDDRVVYVGGTNVADLFATYQDLMLRVEGDLARDVRQQFEYDWYWAGHPEQADRNFRGDAFVGNGLIECESRAGLSTVRMVGNGIGRQSLEGSIINAIDSATTSIRIQLHQFNRVPILDAVIRAAERGVDVKVLLDPSNLDNFIPYMKWGPRGIFNAYAANRLISYGIAVKFAVPEENFEAYHMKFGIFDDRVALVGTPNWTHLGTTRNSETMLEIGGGTIVTDLTQWFDGAWELRAEHPSVGYVSRVIGFFYRQFFK